ncbi:hypothetical protein ACI6QG_01800 [Roseococcus sp. DSY-14]|uniref:hypothetical protein n=1 Tax=Roseococcus sp. DSY-14 TaxID=3369650 RepID=UPI00387A9E8D
MADIKIEIEGDSEEAVALALLKLIMENEEDGEMDRGWILETYSACLATVRGALILDADEGEEGDEEDDLEDEEMEEDDDDAGPVKG